MNAILDEFGQDRVKRLEFVWDWRTKPDGVKGDWIPQITLQSNLSYDEVLLEH